MFVVGNGIWCGGALKRRIIYSLEIVRVLSWGFCWIAVSFWECFEFCIGLQFAFGNNMAAVLNFFALAEMVKFLIWEITLFSLI